MSHKELKEAFVRDLNGTSLEEVGLVTFLLPEFFMIRGLIFILYFQTKRSLPLPLPMVSHLLLDFSVLIIPFVVSCTILSSVIPQLIASLAFLSAGAFFYIYHTSSYTSTHRPKAVISAFLQSHVQFNKVPFLSVFRVFVNVETAVCILAVDFNVFPRRYAKTETYGTGAMDIGVGAYVFANALVCPEVRGRNISGSKINHITKQIVSVWPLVVLGMGRLLTVKMINYQEHVTEYGAHWNFFFTLAVVRVLTSFLLAVLPIKNWSWLFSLLISGFYQFSLEKSGLKEFIIHNNDRGKDFLHANKEGIFSVAGYVAIYLAGVQIGLYVMQPRSRVKEWVIVILNLFFVSFGLYVALYVCQTLVEPVSRRLANLPYCIWTVAQSLLFVSSIGIVDIVVLFSKKTSGSHYVPSTWSLHKKQSDSDSDRKTDETERFCLVQAISRNQLLFFLFANVTTGLTNSLVDTISCGSSLSVCILLLYMFTNCFAVYVLHVCGITVKFW